MLLWPPDTVADEADSKSVMYDKAVEFSTALSCFFKERITQTIDALLLIDGMSGA